MTCSWINISLLSRWLFVREGSSGGGIAVWGAHIVALRGIKTWMKSNTTQKTGWELTWPADWWSVQELTNEWWTGSRHPLNMIPKDWLSTCSSNYFATWTLWKCVAIDEKIIPWFMVSWSMMMCVLAHLILYALGGAPLWKVSWWWTDSHPAKTSTLGYSYKWNSFLVLNIT